jgi:hypothetical protein
MQGGSILDGTYSCCDMLTSTLDSCGICNGDGRACQALVQMSVTLNNGTNITATKEIEESALSWLRSHAFMGFPEEGVEVVGLSSPSAASDSKYSGYPYTNLDVRLESFAWNSFHEYLVPAS